MCSRPPLDEQAILTALNERIFFFLTVDMEFLSQIMFPLVCPISVRKSHNHALRFFSPAVSPSLAGFFSDQIHVGCGLHFEGQSSKIYGHDKLRDSNFCSTSKHQID